MGPRPGRRWKRLLRRNRRGSRSPLRRGCRQRWRRRAPARPDRRAVGSGRRPRRHTETDSAMPSPRCRRHVGSRGRQTTTRQKLKLKGGYEKRELSPEGGAPKRRLGPARVKHGACFHRGHANHKSLSLGGFAATAEARARAGHAHPLGSVVLDNASATTLCSAGKWPTSKDHLRRDCLQESSRDTASMTPLPFSAKASERAAVLSPRTATFSWTK